jgi:hypothetical protein
MLSTARLKSVKQIGRCKEVIASDTGSLWIASCLAMTASMGHSGMNPPACAERSIQLRRRARLAPRAAREVDAENQNLDSHGLMVVAGAGRVKPSNPARPVLAVVVAM